jgi:hypothetical protein
MHKKLHIVLHGQEDPEFEGSLGYGVIACQKKKRKEK